jgi:integral membrane sensor domain MASE1
MPVARTTPVARLGCGFLLLVVIVSCVLLAIDGLIVSNVFGRVRETLPPPFNDHRWSQAIVFLGPVLLLAIQWWAYDVAVDWLWPMRTRLDRKG